MTETNYAADVGKYASSVNDQAIAGIVKHIGIAAKSKDGAFVSCSDKSERDRVRDSFLKKHLGRSEADADLDKTVQDVCQRMNADPSKSRVTFYYLLAEKYGALGQFANEAYAADVRKYTRKKVDVKTVAGIIKHLGIAMQSRDASLVACSDKAERDRVRDSFLKGKLALTAPDADLDKSVEETCQKMADEPNKSRVTFYYLLAEKHGKLGLFESA